MQPKFYLTHLYPEQMSIYGDMGNILALKFFLEKYGFEIVYQAVHPGENLPEKSDFYFIGGGQDQDQYLICQDLLQKKDKLFEDIEKNIPILAICGGYQLLGQEFLTGDGKTVPGIGLFDVSTRSPDDTVTSRCIGNIVIDCQISGLEGVKLVGFENHGGQTYFTSERCKPLGKVVVGFGNNAKEKLEGCVYKNAIGTYLHGSCLPKNPELTEYLLKWAVRRKHEAKELSVEFFRNFKKIEIDKTISLKAKNALIERFVPKNS